MLYWPLPNTLYVEGFGLDAFARGEWALRPVHQNRIGTSVSPKFVLYQFMNSSISEGRRLLSVNAVA